MNTSLYGGLIEISPDGQPIAPDLVLAYRGGTKQGIIHNVQSLTNKNDLAQAAEITFDVYKKVDNVTCELWNDIRDFRLIYIPHLDTASFNPWYELSVETDEDDATIKHCQGVHLQEAELGQLSLNDIEINTEDDIVRDDYTPTIIYDPTNPEGSALDRILKDKASHYTIVHVDSSIANLQRTFSWDGSTIKGAFDDIANEVECLFVYGESVNNDGKIHRTISVYDLNDVCMECGERGTFTNKMCTKCNSANIKFGYGSDSGIFLSHENFAGNISYSSNKDEVKNCFRLVAGDDLMTATIRNINPSGSQYIWYFSDSVRADMSKTLRDKLSTYEKEYASYSSDKKIDIPSTVISDYNTLINKYKLYDSSLMNVKYPIVGYSSLTDLYYSALNFYSLLKTTLAPVSERGTKTTAAQEIKKLNTNTLSPLGIQNANKASVSTVTLALQNYAKVFVDTSLYRITATNDSYSGNVWKGTITLSSYADENDKATTSIITIYVSDATSDFIKCQLEKAMKKNDVDATGTVALFKKDEAEFKKALSFYSVDNLNILASIVRGCLDILIQQGIADPENDMYESMYYPYYSKSIWIEDELRERESEILKLRGSKSNPEGVLDYIEKQRQVIANNLDLHTYLGNSLWTEFCSFRRDDTYKNDNFISDGLSDKELIMQAKEFIKNAEREIVKSATLQHTISCNLSNFLLVKEQDVESSPVPIVTLAGVNIVSHDQLYFVKGDATFSPLLVNFDVGNWVRIEIDETIYKLRLTSYKIDYDNLDSLNVEFSDVTYGLNSASDIQSILSQAQSMSTSYSMVQHQANKGNNANKQIMDMVENGLNLTNKKIVNAADNQNMVVDETGLLMREKNEFGDDYSSEQTKIINHGFYYTNDGWKTVQTGLGKYIYFDPESGTYKEDYGIIAHKIVGNIILGNKVGIYNTSGSVKIDENGFTVTSDANDTNKDLFTLQRKNEDGSYTKYVYVDDDGNIKINGKHIQMTTSDDLGSYIDKTIKQEASALVVQLDNEYIGITTDSNGNGGNFTDCYTNVTVFSGSTDITKSSDLSWTITATSGVTGEWDKTKYRYTLKGLSTDRGEVVFDLIYMGKIAISKKLRIAKLKAGATGGQGIQGIPGKDGKDGISTYIHIKYSSVANPTDDMLTEVPAAYIGICVDTNLNDPITASSYTWSRFSGKDGADGTPGLDGKDGEDSFVHFAYAQSADGSVNFNVCEYEGATYIGVYTDNIKADSTDYKKYAWSKFKGDDGKDGDSIYITSTEVVYIPSDNGIAPPQANSLATSDGKNIVDSNGNEIATNKWLSSIPYVIEGSYLWTRTTVNYSDGNSTVTYSVSRQGIDGTDGKDGINGRDGRDGSSNYVHIKYSAYPNPTDDQISEIPSDYIGICVNDVIKDPDSASSYVWSKFAGKDGEDGIPGKNGYVHFAYADSSDGKTGFDTVNGTNKKYIGQYTDNVKTDSKNPTDYTWSKIKGDDVTIISTKVEYITTTENSSVPPESVELVTNDGKSLIDNSSNLFVTNKWSDEIPDLVDGMYLWTRTTVQYSDGNSTVSYTNAKQGDVGDAGRTYFLELDTSAVKIDGNNIITPDTIKAKGYYRDGDGDRVVYPCRFIISKTYSDNRTEEIISSSNNISEQIFTIYGEANMPAFYTVEMHKANQIPTEDNLLDIQTIPILVDSANMMIGARNLLKKSNELGGCHYYGTNNVYNITEDEIDSKHVIKVQSGAGSNATKAVYYEVYTDNLVGTDIGTKLTVSMNVYSRQNQTINVSLANVNGVMQTTDMQQVQLLSGWNKVYVVLTLEDTEFELVTDERISIATSTNQVFSTGNVGIVSNVLRITDSMNSGDYYAINYIQLEKGNRPTDYYPAPEDLIDYTDRITGDMSDELKNIIAGVLSQVTANRKDFDDLIGEEGRIEEIRKSSVTTQQQVDRVQTDINTYIVQVDALNGRIMDIEQTTECFSMEDAGLRITRKILSQDPDKQLSMLLSEQKLSFYQGTDEVAYFSNNKLYVTDAEILDKLQLGKFAYIPRSNGNLSFRYLGGK